jgi:transcriptional regulator with PAS, ATPase and Fis domain
MAPEIQLEHIFRDLFESIGGIIVIDRQANIVYMNDNYARLFDISPPYPIGEKIYDVILGEKLSRILETQREDMIEFYEIKGQKLLCSRLLIKHESQIIGAYAFTQAGLRFTEKQLERRFDYLNKQLDYYKNNYKETGKPKYNISQIITDSPKVKQLISQAKKVAQTRSNVLISGESGTGKELFAHSIHTLSNRSNMPFIVLNCAAIPETLLESELFGYAEGSFTGASKGGKKGKIWLADGGTIFLDEINSLPLSLQGKLLRMLQEKEVQVIGGETKEVDVRFIVSTNQDLLKLVEEGKFRTDLFYRINVFELKIPPLRERKEDIPPLVYHFINKLNDEMGLNITGITDSALELLKQYDWPGNVRELENIIERSLNLAMTGELDLEHFDILKFKLNKNNGKTVEQFSLDAARQEAETSTIMRAIKYAKGNKKLTASLLGIDRSVLYDKIEKYNIKL